MTTSPDTLQLLRDAVSAQLRLWATMEALRHKLYPDDNSPRHQSDAAFDSFVAGLAIKADHIEQINSAVTREHVDRLQVLALEHIIDT